MVHSLPAVPAGYAQAPEHMHDLSEGERDAIIGMHRWVESAIVARAVDPEAMRETVPVSSPPSYQELWWIKVCFEHLRAASTPMAIRRAHLAEYRSLHDDYARSRMRRSPWSAHDASVVLAGDGLVALASPVQHEIAAHLQSALTQVQQRIDHANDLYVGDANLHGGVPDPAYWLRPQIMAFDSD